MRLIALRKTMFTLLVAVLGTLLVSPSSGTAEAAHSHTTRGAPAAANGCEFGNAGGRIMEVWRELGGPNSALGCPLEPGERNGRENGAAWIRVFANGEATWSPWTGDGAVLYTWREPAGIRIGWRMNWSNVHTDKWQINWVNGSTELRNLPQDRGDYLLPANPYQFYSVTVQSCRDGKGFGRSVCRGWMERVFSPERLPGVRAELRVGGQTTVLYDNDRILLDAANFAWGGSRAQIKDNIRRSVHGKGRGGYSAYAVEADLAETGEVQTRTEAGKVVVEFVTRGNWVTFKAHTPSGCGRVCNPGFRVTYDTVITMTAPLTNSPGTFRLNEIGTRVENVRVDGTNLQGELAEIFAPSAMRDIARGAIASGNKVVMEDVNIAITPLTSKFSNDIPVGSVYLNAWIDGRGKLILVMGTP